MRKLGMNALAFAALVAVSAGAGGGAGCAGTKPTELVPGVSSQVVVPHDLQAVRVTVLANGRTVFDQGYDVGPDGVVELPSTLGVVSGPVPSTVVTITIRGYQSTCDMSDDCLNQTDNPVGDTGAQILRRSVQTFVDQRTLFLPMPLSYSCWNNGGCSATQTCKGNQCVDHSTDSASLVDFDPSLLDGTDVCFSPKECFADAVPAQVVDAPSCTYAFPAIPGQPATGAGLNVRVWYQDFQWTLQSGVYANVLQNGGEEEILNLDTVEGFTLGGTVPDAGATAAPQQVFQLAPGLCKLAQAATYPPSPPPLPSGDGGAAAPAPDAGTGEYVTISHVEVANLCPPKPPLLPICAGERSNAATLPGGSTTPDGTCNVGVTMTPTQSALYLAFDDSQVMNGAFGSSGSATALSVSLTDPVFKRTYAAFKFLPHDAADCTATGTSFLMPGVPFGLAGSVQTQIADSLLTWKAPDLGTMTCSSNADCPSTAPVCSGTGVSGMSTCVAPAALDLQAALRLDGGIYADILGFLGGKGAVNVAAAMFFVNRAPTLANDCSPPLGASTVMGAIEGEIQAAYLNTPSLRTYFVVLDDDAHDTTSATGALTFFDKVQSDLPQAVTTLDATTSKNSQMAAQQVGVNFSKIVTQLGTCLYDYGLPSTATPAQVAIAYTIPGQSKTTIPADANCNAQNQAAVSGWNVDQGRVRICGQACTDLQSGILAATGAALMINQAPPDIAVTATLLCTPTALVSDAGPVMMASEAGAGLGTSDGSSLGTTEEASAGGDDASTGSAGGDASGATGASDGSADATVVDASGGTDDASGAPAH